MNEENNDILSICIGGVAGLSPDQVIRKFQTASRDSDSLNHQIRGKKESPVLCPSVSATVPWLYDNVIIILPSIHHGKSGMNEISNTVFHNSSWRPGAIRDLQLALPREDDLYDNLQARQSQA